MRWYWYVDSEEEAEEYVLRQEEEYIRRREEYLRNEGGTLSKEEILKECR